MDGGSDNGATEARPPLPNGGGADEALAPKRPRRPPNPEEQKRRQAWGAEWGPKVGDAYRTLERMMR